MRALALLLVLQLLGHVQSFTSTVVRCGSSGWKGKGRSPSLLGSVGVDRAGFLVGVAGVLVGTAVKPAEAFCGETFPMWAYEVDFNEGAIPFQFGSFKGDLYLREVGGERKEAKNKLHPLLLIPTQGLFHEYLSTVEAVVQKDNRVITFDPIGVGTSSPLPQPQSDNASLRKELLSPACLQAQIDAVIAHLKIKGGLHLMGHGTGAALALQRALAPPAAAAPPILSLILASPILSGGVGAGLPKTYVEDSLTTYTKRDAKLPICLESAASKYSNEVVDALPLSAAAASASDPGLRAIGVPVLVTKGKDDPLLNKDDMSALLKSLPAERTTVQTFEGGHFPHLDDKEAYVKSIQGFIKAAEPNP